MAKSLLDPRIDVLVQMYDQAFDRPAWHGPNLRNALRGLKLPEALWRPAPNRHNIWEIALHCAYWKYAIWRRITGAKRGAFPRKPSDWPALPSAQNSKAWSDDLALLEHWHAQLRNEILRFPPARFSKKPAGSSVSFLRTIYGISSHDLYHAGQIQLLKRLQRAK
ncbi:MAG TPA: DinB family protein [candidate division Zixibacteria bacterium]|nr:DinB family protein [candidate division Zixibacteria bacterium]